MAGWHHRLDGREFEWTPGVGDGQGGLACCDSWGCKESDTTERLNWTELKVRLFSFIIFNHQNFNIYLYYNKGKLKRNENANRNFVNYWVASSGWNMVKFFFLLIFAMFFKFPTVCLSKFYNQSTINLLFKNVMSRQLIRKPW